MAITTTEFAQARNQRRRQQAACPRQIRNAPMALTLASLLTALLTSLASPAVHAGEWKFVPSVSVTETLTDNVRLAGRGGEEGDLVTQVSPGFTLSNNSALLKARINYALQANLYATSSTASSFSNLLNANVAATLIRDLETKVLARLPDDTWVYPGHGIDTTLGAERDSLPAWRARGW